MGFGAALVAPNFCTHVVAHCLLQSRYPSHLSNNLVLDRKHMVRIDFFFFFLLWLEYCNFRYGSASGHCCEVGIGCRNSIY